MRTKKIVGLGLALSLVLTASLAFAQPMGGGMKGWQGSGGWGKIGRAHV